MQNGIVVAGNVVVDNVKTIDKYPQKNMLATIINVSKAVGGAVCNTSIDLKIIDKKLSVKAFGSIGDDENGNFITGNLSSHGVDVSNITISKDLFTSFTDVMSEAETGERTFFYNKGANAKFNINQSMLDDINCSIFHIGYILLLDELDEFDLEYGTRLARLLNNIQNKGIKTSIDIVSDSGDRFKKIVRPALKYTDYCIINEIEAGEITGITPRVNDKINIDNLHKICLKLLELGIRDRVVIHCPEAGVVMDSEKNFTVVGSLILPSGYIKGTVGAGDAFCAGALFSIYNNYSNQKMLEFASACSACNLSRVDSISGMKDKQEIEKISNKFLRRIL